MITRRYLNPIIAFELIFTTKKVQLLQKSKLQNRLCLLFWKKIIINLKIKLFFPHLYLKCFSFFKVSSIQKFTSCDAFHDKHTLSHTHTHTHTYFLSLCVTNTDADTPTHIHTVSFSLFHTHILLLFLLFPQLTQVFLNSLLI